MYEVSLKVENALIEMKAALMKPYPESGLEKLKQYCKSHPQYLQTLIKRNIVRLIIIVLIMFFLSNVKSFFVNDNNKRIFLLKKNLIS